MFLFRKKWEWENFYYNFDAAYRIDFLTNEDIKIYFPSEEFIINKNTCSAYKEFKAHLENNKTSIIL